MFVNVTVIHQMHDILLALESLKYFALMVQSHSESTTRLFAQICFSKVLLIVFDAWSYTFYKLIQVAGVSDKPSGIQILFTHFNCRIPVHKANFNV